MELTINEQQWSAGSSELDLDSAWDEAKSTVLAVRGAGFWAGGLYPEDFEVIDAPVAREALARIDSSKAGPVARAISQPRDWAKRKARVSYTETAVILPPGEVPRELTVADMSDDVITSLLEEVGKGLAQGETIARVTLLGLRQRTKVVVTRHKGPSERRYAVVVGDRVVEVVSTSAQAVLKSKELALLGERSTVWAYSGRDGQRGLVEVEPQVVSQRASLAVEIVRLKDQSKNRVGGWEFTGPREAPTFVPGPQGTQGLFVEKEQSEGPSGEGGYDNE